MEKKIEAGKSMLFSGVNCVWYFIQFVQRERQ